FLFSGAHATDSTWSIMGIFEPNNSCICPAVNDSKKSSHVTGGPSEKLASSAIVSQTLRWSPAIHPWVATKSHLGTTSPARPETKAPRARRTDDSHDAQRGSNE